MNFDISNRRYIGNKSSLNEWILESIPAGLRGGTFFDVFSGTGTVAAAAIPFFKKIIVNDLLFSNEAIYKGFFGTQPVEENLLQALMPKAVSIVDQPNFFDRHFGGKYFSQEDARLIGALRIAIDTLIPKQSRTRFVALASLIYSADRSANTVGHYEAFLRNGKIRPFNFEFINPLNVEAEIYREDSNSLSRRVSSEVAYLDPPYNSRQYSRFYHVLETLTKWDDPELFGVALKPKPENISEYSKVSAAENLKQLVGQLDTKLILISYNNTYLSKSSSSRNKISLEQIHEIASSRGKVQVLERQHKHFNAGKTSFDDHKELLFRVET